MNESTFTRLMDALAYAVESTAHRRDPKTTQRILALRDEIREAFPEHARKADTAATLENLPRRK